MPKQIRPYGSWVSPITPSMLAKASQDISSPFLSADHVAYWLESRPLEEGRYVIMRQGREDKNPVQLTPAPFNVRTRVHEYGGAPYTVANDTLYFSHYGDHRLYRQIAGSAPKAITPAAPMRYADLLWDDRRRCLLAVREDHSQSDVNAVNSIVRIDPDRGDSGVPLVDGCDFYMYPRLSPDGGRLAWICWNHPNMPWDGTELWIGEFAPDGQLTHRMKIAGGPTESIFQPAWSPDGILYFVSDRTGWWNLYRWDQGQTQTVLPLEAEFGRPAWVFGISMYGFSSDRLIAIYSQHGTDHLIAINPKEGSFEEIVSPYTTFADIQCQVDDVILLAGSPIQPAALVRLDTKGWFLTVVRSEVGPVLDPEDISEPTAVEFPTAAGFTAHMWYYPPKNSRFAGPDTERPPLIVFNHGGPTSQSDSSFSLVRQFWTSRGFAVADVNYRGSTGYGRAYRQLLNHAWGVVDVEDCCNAALYLVDAGLADPNRLAIRGGSAGGYTTLACLTFRDVFAVGASYYGVSDIAALARDTHKFESRYMERLVGPWPDDAALFADRSPLMHTDRIHRPVIFFQGLDDRVVPPNQAQLMVDDLAKRGVPVAYLTFAGEGHGFHGAHAVEQSIAAELSFYTRILHLQTDEELPSVAIANWPR